MNVPVLLTLLILTFSFSSLRGEDPFTNPFDNPVDNSALPRVLIIGDSIATGLIIGRFYFDWIHAKSSKITQG